MKTPSGDQPTKTAKANEAIDKEVSRRRQQREGGRTEQRSRPATQTSREARPAQSRSRYSVGR
ncbi:hypothetical protein [Synechococcus elongatus]|uniref:hypothetical protein n=1 Tax=Synechococcus elongatus TaxID=32046 RepID=UPI000F7F990C|nr:hypothetical protein [Synechococcus elongatus]